MLLVGAACDAPPAPKPPPSLFPVCVDDQWGFIDRTGKIVISPRFARAMSFSEDRAAVNIGGKWVKEPTEHGSWTVFRGGAWGYCDPEGNMAIEATFEDARDFSEGLAAVRIDGKWGHVDLIGRMVVEPRFAWAGGFHEGLAAVGLRPDETEIEARLCGFIDRTGRLVIPAKYPDAKPFSDGLAAVCITWPSAENMGLEQWAFVDHKGRLLHDRTYRFVLPFSERLAAVFKGDWTIEYINPAGHTVFVAQRPDGQPLEAHYFFGRWRGYKDEAGSFSEGLAPFKIDAHEIHLYMDGPGHGFYYEGGTWGFLDKRGRIVVKPRFADAQPFSEGLAAVAETRTVDTPHDDGTETVRTFRKWGYIDRTGRTVIDMQFDTAGPFQNGVARVEIGDDWHDRSIGYIDKTGRYVWQPRK